MSILWAIILSILVYLFFYLYRFYYVMVKRYPIGPTPLPIIGNVLYLLGNLKQNPLLTFIDLSKKYGKVLTFWFGSVPVVMIFDLDIGKEAFSKNEFSSRFHTPVNDMLNGNDYQCFVCMDYGKTWKNLRKLSYEALRNMMTKNKFAEVINDVVENTVSMIKVRESGSPFNPLGYLTPMFVRIISGVTFGKIYVHNDDELNSILNAYETFNKQIVKKCLMDFVPITKYFLIMSENYSIIQKMQEIFRSNYEKCCETHQKDSCNNFCDSVITSKNISIDSGSESSQYFTHNNLIGILNGLFVGGSDSSIHTFHWMILLMAYYSEIQSKLRTEVKNKIGERLPEASDKINCDFIIAFVCETMRFRSIVPIGMPHKTLSHTKIGEYSVPKDTCVILHQYSIMNDTKYWSSPELFMPQRFIDSDSDKFIGTRTHPAFIPFSTGKRVCVGEKFSLDMNFLALARMLQLTSDYRFVLPNGPQTDHLSPKNTGFLLAAKDYEIILEKS